MENYIYEFWKALIIVAMIFSPVIFFKVIRALTKFNGMHVREAYIKIRRRGIIAFSAVLVLALVSFALLELG